MLNKRPHAALGSHPAATPAHLGSPLGVFWGLGGLLQPLTQAVGFGGDGGWGTETPQWHLGLGWGHHGLWIPNLGVFIFFGGGEQPHLGSSDLGFGLPEASEGSARRRSGVGAALYFPRAVLRTERHQKNAPDPTRGGLRGLIGVGRGSTGPGGSPWGTPTP